MAIRKKSGPIRTFSPKLEQAVRRRLREDPDFIDELKDILNEAEFVFVSEDDDLFESLKPQFTHEDPRKGKTRIIISPESVDTLSLPGVRKKLKEWQRKALDSTEEEEERRKAKSKLRRVFDSLVFVGQGRPEKPTPEQKRILRQTYRATYEEAEGICRESRRNPANRRLLVKSKFNEHFGPNLNPSDSSLKTPEGITKAVFAHKFRCSIRGIEEAVRELSLTAIHKHFEKPEVRTGVTKSGRVHKKVSLQGHGKSKKIW